jgi:hypothetical protein
MTHLEAADHAWMLAALREMAPAGPVHASLPPRGPGQLLGAITAWADR